MRLRVALGGAAPATLLNLVRWRRRAGPLPPSHLTTTHPPQAHPTCRLCIRAVRRGGAHGGAPQPRCATLACPRAWGPAALQPLSRLAGSHWLAGAVLLPRCAVLRPKPESTLLPTHPRCAGHYVALVKTPSGQWVCFDDEQVNAVTEAQVWPGQAWQLGRARPCERCVARRRRRRPPPALLPSRCLQVQSVFGHTQDWHPTREDQQAPHAGARGAEWVAVHWRLRGRPDGWCVWCSLHLLLYPLLLPQTTATSSSTKKCSRGSSSSRSRSSSSQGSSRRRGRRVAARSSSCISEGTVACWLSPLSACTNHLAL